jgi:hypothetical protein
MVSTYGAGRIFWIFLSWLSACPPPARHRSRSGEAGGSASPSGEAGGDENQEIAIAFGEYMKNKFH